MVQTPRVAAQKGANANLEGQLFWVGVQVLNCANVSQRGKECCSKQISSPELAKRLIGGGWKTGEGKGGRGSSRS